MFADLGLRGADELLAKADLAHAIHQLIEAQGLSQRGAARLRGVAQPDLSNLSRGRLEGFSIERLCRLLTALGQDVRIVVQPKPRSRARATFRTRCALPEDRADGEDQQVDISFALDR
ncbi:MAG: helix-turn-helix domain-containing protein [Steroidobacteraceae bacterium]